MPSLTPNKIKFSYIQSAGKVIGLCFLGCWGCFASGLLSQRADDQCRMTRQTAHRRLSTTIMPRLISQPLSCQLSTIVDSKSLATRPFTRSGSVRFLYLPSLEEMSRWHTFGHILWYYIWGRRYSPVPENIQLHRWNKCVCVSLERVYRLHMGLWWKVTLIVSWPNSFKLRSRTFQSTLV